MAALDQPVSLNSGLGAISVVVSFMFRVFRQRRYGLDNTVSLEIIRLHIYMALLLCLSPEGADWGMRV